MTEQSIYHLPFAIFHSFIFGKTETAKSPRTAEFAKTNNTILGFCA